MSFQGVVGRLEGAWAWGLQGARQFKGAAGDYRVVVMSAGSVWVADRFNHRLCLLR